MITIVSEELPIADANQWRYTTPALGGQGIYYLLPPVNVFPPDGDENVAQAANFLEWANGGGATHFDVYFSTRAKYLESGEQLAAENLPVSQVKHFFSQQLLYNTAYVWRVVAKNTYFAIDGGLWDFKTKSLVGEEDQAWPYLMGNKFVFKLIAAANDTIWYEE